MKKKRVDTFYCYFVIGVNHGYDKDTEISKQQLIDHIANFQKQYWDDSCSVNVADQQTIVYGDYCEDCYKVEAINYPRFPKKRSKIEKFMLTLIEYLMVNLKQNRITLVMPDSTIMLQNDIEV